MYTKAIKQPSQWPLAMPGHLYLPPALFARLLTQHALYIGLGASYVAFII
jgi:hypothetical protein